MKARLIAALLFALAVTPPAGATDCPQDRAVYTEPHNGYQLRFRPPKPWEVPVNTDAVIDLTFPDGSKAWGTTWMPNGTSWNRAQLFDGCTLPGLVTPGSSEPELEACRIWSGVIYALAGDDAGHLPNAGEPAAPTILLSDLGPTLRYSGLVAGPGDEPHDVFTLSGCQTKLPGPAPRCCPQCRSFSPC